MEYLPVVCSDGTIREVGYKSFVQLRILRTISGSTSKHQSKCQVDFGGNKEISNVKVSN